MARSPAEQRAARRAQRATRRYVQGKGPSPIAGASKPTKRIEATRKKLEDDIIARKERMFGGSFKFNPKASERAVRKAYLTERELKYYLELSEETIEIGLETDPGNWPVFWYH